MRAPWPACVFFLLFWVHACLPAARAHAPDSGSAPLRRLSLSLRHIPAADLILLLSREERPAGGVAPRAAVASRGQALLPPGVESVLRSGGSEVILVGSEESILRFQELLAVFDVPAEAQEGRRLLRLEPKRSTAETIRHDLRGAAGGGRISVDSGALQLDGEPRWVHSALRRILARELGLATGGDPAGRL